MPRHKPRHQRHSPKKTASVDLHLHSTASDGVYAPAKVVELAAARGLTTIALTDHDTTDGLDEARAAADAHGLHFINGIECDAATSKGTLHLLGYFIDPQHAGLSQFLAEAARRRGARNRQLLEKLKSHGIDLDEGERLSETVLNRLGRRQLALRLVKMGVVNHPSAAFREYLGEGGKAYVPMPSPSARDVINILHAAGGVVALAHPVTLHAANALELETIIARFVHHGLDGIEVDHPAQSSSQRQQLQRMANRFGLVATGGSDFHALAFKQPRGIGFGVSVTEEVVGQLKERQLTRSDFSKK